MTQDSRYLLHCHRFGPVDGPPLLLLNGLGGGLATWTKVAETLAYHRRVLAPDLLGFGRSPRPRVQYTLEDHLQSLDALLESAGLGGTPVHLVGHSMGAILAVELAARHPGAFRGVTLVGLPYFPSAQQARAHVAQFGLLGRLTLGQYWGANALCVAMGWLRPMLLRTLPYLPGKLPTAVVREALRQDFAAFSRSLQNVVVSHRLDGAIDRLSQRRVLLIHGSKDRAAPISNVRQLVQGVPRWELVEAPDLAHNVPLQDPGLVAKLVDSDARRACSSKNP